MAGPIEQTVKLPDKPDDELRAATASRTGSRRRRRTTSACRDFPSVNEAEPNDTTKQATAYDGPLPVAFNGIIAKPRAGESEPGRGADGEKLQDNDYFQFKAKKGQVLDVNVYARRLRSPLDPVLYVYDATGKRSAPTTTRRAGLATSSSPCRRTGITSSASATTSAARATSTPTASRSRPPSRRSR